MSLNFVRTPISRFLATEASFSQWLHKQPAPWDGLRIGPTSMPLSHFLLSPDKAPWFQEASIERLGLTKSLFITMAEMIDDDGQSGLHCLLTHATQDARLPQVEQHLSMLLRLSPGMSARPKLVRYGGAVDSVIHLLECFADHHIHTDDPDLPRIQALLSALYNDGKPTFGGGKHPLHYIASGASPLLPPLSHAMWDSAPNRISELRVVSQSRAFRSKNDEWIKGEPVDLKDVFFHGENNRLSHIVSQWLLDDASLEHGIGDHMTWWSKRTHQDLRLPVFTPPISKRQPHPKPPTYLSNVLMAGPGSLFRKRRAFIDGLVMLLNERHVDTDGADRTLAAFLSFLELGTDKKTGNILSLPSFVLPATIPLDTTMVPPREVFDPPHPRPLSHTLFERTVLKSVTDISKSSGSFEQEVDKAVDWLGFFAAQSIDWTAPTTCSTITADALPKPLKTLFKKKTPPSLLQIVYALGALVEEVGNTYTSHTFQDTVSKIEAVSLRMSTVKALNDTHSERPTKRGGPGIL